MLRIGIAQICTKRGDRAENYSLVEKWMAENCKPSDTETVIVLPEIWDVGYAINKADKLADPEGREAISFLSGLAKKYNVWFAGGSVLAGTEKGAVNRAIVIDPTGRYVAHYDKVHLYPLLNEDRYLAAGSEECLFEIGGATAGCVICYDIRFCEWVRLCAVHGAKILFVSADWPAKRIGHWQTLLRARAIENMMYVAACGRAGKNGDGSAGHSMVIDPWGKVLYEAPENEAAAFIDIDLSAVGEARKYLKVLDARRPELYRE